MTSKSQILRMAHQDPVKLYEENQRLQRELSEGKKREVMLHAIADMLEPHWKGAGAELGDGWMLQRLGEVFDSVAEGERLAEYAEGRTKALQYARQWIEDAARDLGDKPVLTGDGTDLLKLIDAALGSSTEIDNAKNPNPSGHLTAEASSTWREASGPVGLGPDEQFEIDHSGLPGDDKGFPTMEEEEDHAREATLPIGVSTPFRLDLESGWIGEREGFDGLWLYYADETVPLRDLSTPEENFVRRAYAKGKADAAVCTPACHRLSTSTGEALDVLSDVMDFLEPCPRKGTACKCRLCRARALLDRNREALEQFHASTSEAKP